VVKLFHSKPPTTPPPISTRSTTPPPTATTLVAITTTPPPPPQDLIAVVAWPTAVATSLHHYRYHLVLLTQLALLATNTMDKGIYHERQSLAFCALHAINNLLQYRAFTKTLLDDISHSLAPCQNINPHRSFLYDPARACNQGHLPCAIGNLIGIVIGGIDLVALGSTTSTSFMQHLRCMAFASNGSIDARNCAHCLSINWQASSSIERSVGSL
jgi:hypothetical protein